MFSRSWKFDPEAVPPLWVLYEIHKEHPRMNRADTNPKTMAVLSKNTWHYAEAGDYIVMEENKTLWVLKSLAYEALITSESKEIEDGDC